MRNPHSRFPADWDIVIQEMVIVFKHAAVQSVFNWNYGMRRFACFHGIEYSPEGNTRKRTSILVQQFTNGNVAKSSRFPLKRSTIVRFSAIRQVVLIQHISPRYQNAAVWLRFAARAGD